MQSHIDVPQVDVPRYAAPRITRTEVTSVIPTEPVPGAPQHPGHYQHVLLNTRTGELSFHEGDQHLTPWLPSWHALNDVPRALRDRWYPGTAFLPNDGHMLFRPVPELLSFTVDSGHEAMPYLGVNDANTLLTGLVPCAQELLDSLYDVAGDLDWSAAAVHAGRNLLRLTSRHQQDAGPEADSDLADFADVVARYPQVYRPEMMRLAPDDLPEECEYQTRYLGTSQHWHPEIKETFGYRRTFADSPRPHTELKVAGVRAWYRAALLNGDPRPVKAFRDWEAQHGHLAAGEVTSSMGDEQLVSWAEREEERAAVDGWRLLGARRAARRHRDLLREQEWDRLAVVGTEIADLERRLKPLRAERQALVAKAISWGRGDSEIGGQGRVSRQAVFQTRERLQAEADTES